MALLSGSCLRATRVPIPVRVESGSHLLSGPNSTHKVGNGKPWQELHNLLLTLGTVHWNSSPHEAAPSPSIADPQADLTACSCNTRETPIDGWVQTQPDCASQPRQGNASTRGKMTLSLHSARWVLRPTLPTELRFLFLTKHGVPLRLILLLAPALQHLTRPYTCSLPLARLPTQAAHSFSVPHRGSFHCNMQADAFIQMSDAGPVLDRHPVITPRYGVLRRLYVLWTLTHTVAGATGLRTSENTVMASLTSANAASHSAST